MLLAVQRRYRHVLVDEYQDTNSAQMALLQMVREGSERVSETAIGITVVGDDDQSIYSFRGAEPGIFEAFRKSMSPCATVTLSQNYRSSLHILQAASGVIAKSAGRVAKGVWTQNGAGEPVAVCQCGTGKHEVDWVVSQLLELRERGTPFSDVAILYRTHAIGHGFYTALRKCQVPLRTATADAFARSDIAPLVTLLRLVTNEDDSASFAAVARAMRPPLPAPLLGAIADDAARRGQSQLATARALYAALGPVPSAQCDADSVRALVAATAAAMDCGGYASLHALLRRVDELVQALRSSTPSQLCRALLQSGLVGDLRPDAPPAGVKLLSEELTAAVDAFQSGDLGPGLVGRAVGGTDRMAALRSFVEHAALSELEEAPDDGQSGRNRGGLTLSTIHGAKGLEWPIVFIVRCNEDVIPLNACMADEEVAGALLSEERRLLYVAMTRARRALYVSYLVMSDDRQPMAPSCFLKDIPAANRKNAQHESLRHSEVTFGVPASSARLPSSSLKRQSGGTSQQLPGAIGAELRFWQEAPEPAASSRKSKSGARRAPAKATAPDPRPARAPSKKRLSGGSGQYRAVCDEDEPWQSRPAGQRRAVTFHNDDDDFE